MTVEPVIAYVPLRQSSWSGGYGQQVWSDSSKFHEYSHLNYADTLTIDNRNQDNWYDSKWKYRRQIKFNNLENGELSHFPILVKLVHKDNFNYDKVHSQGNDIRFTDSDGTTIIPHDIEKWEETGTSYVWVKVPNIKASSNDDYIYMYYGNPETIDTRNPTGVFDGNFVTVHHLAQTPTNNGTYSDATNRGHNGTLEDSFNRARSGAEGKIGLAHEVVTGSPANTRVLISDHDDLDFDTSTDFTVEGWINATGTLTGRFIEKRQCPSSCTGGYNFHFNTVVNKIRVLVENSTGSNCIIDGPTGTDIRNTGWRYMVAVVYRRSSCTVNDMLIFLDGKRQTTSVTASSINTNANISTSTDLSLGIQPPFTSTAGTLVGKMDEVRISNTARDPAWIKASYETVMGDFQTYSNEETLGGNLISSIFNAGHGNNWGYLSYEADEPDKTAAKVKIRTGNNMYMSDAPDFEVCDSITNKSDISSNKCVTDGHRYIQYQVILDTTDAGKTPTFKSISITDFLSSNVKPVVKGISTVTTPAPIIENLDFATPRPAPMPSPSPNKLEAKKLNPIVDFLNALFH